MLLLSGSVGRGGVNRPQDVKAVQELINKHIGRLTPWRPLVVDGRIGPLTIGAIEEFQRRIVHLSRPDGRVDPGGQTLRALQGQTGAAAAPLGAPVSGVEAPWLRIARGEIGQREIRGAQHNPRILQYIETFPNLADIRNKRDTAYLSEEDETAWCACFVNWCLIQAGKAPGPSARAREWLQYGRALNTPQVGAVCIVYHRPNRSTSGVTASGYHVAFWTGGSGNSITLCGGNQAVADRTTEEVNEKTTHGYWTVMGYRWPR
jgi:uncharacterized protein (TIGR02594 family)